MSRKQSNHKRAAPPVVALAALALLALGALFALDRLYHAEQFRIRGVEVHGRLNKVDAAQVKAAVTGQLPGNYFSVDLAALEARIAELPWVFAASVRRKWPDALAVEITEVQPVAAWGAHHWLHANGQLVARPAEAGAGNAQWRDLPKLSGPGAGDGEESREEIWRAYQTWSKAFAAQGLILDQLHCDARGLCYLQLSVSALAGGGRNGDGELAAAPIRVIVPREDAGARIGRLMQALRHPRLGDFADLRAVDLRYPNGFAARWAGAAAAAAETKTAAAAAAATASTSTPSLVDAR